MKRKIKPIRIDLRRLRSDPAVEMLLWGKQVWASAEEGTGIVTNYLHQAGCHNVPLFSEGVYGAQNPKRLINVVSQNSYRILISGRCWSSCSRAFMGPGSQGSLAFHWDHRSAFVRKPTLHLPVVNTHILHLLAFFCHTSSASLCWLSSRAISANMLYMVISSTALSLPGVDVIQKKAWKHVPSIFPTSHHGEDENIQ